MSIYSDLGIDFSEMMTNPQQFHDDVHEAANSLVKVMKSNTSIQDYMNKQEMPTLAELQPYKTQLDNIYSDADSDLSIKGCLEMAKACRKMASDLEWLAKEKAMKSMAADDNAMDKSTAHVLYTELRTNFNGWLEAMTTLRLYKEGTKLVPMPGNYGAPVGLIHYVFTFEDGEKFFNHLSACKHMGVEKMNLMDTIEYINTHPELKITITKLTN
jgi:hypothetical protein